MNKINDIFNTQKNKLIHQFELYQNNEYKITYSNNEKIILITYNNIQYKIKIINVTEYRQYFKLLLTLKNYFKIKNLNLTRRDGSICEVVDLSQLSADSRLCTELFGTSAVPRNMSLSKTMSWADGLFRERRRVLENLREVFLEYKQRYEEDKYITQDIAGLT